MNLIQTIKSTLDRTLHVILDDEEIIITKIGDYENRTWYSWVSWGPTEGSEPSYHSTLITEEEVIKRISILSNDEELDQGLNLAIDHFFGRAVWQND
jgi:hypothetical protein